MLFRLRGGFIAFANTLGLLMNMQEEEISIVNINLQTIYFVLRNFNVIWVECGDCESNHKFLSLVSVT